jgi:regulatory protein
MQSDPPRLVAGAVTEIAPQQRSTSRRLNVFVDGVYAFSLAEEVAASLSVGRVLDVAACRELVERDSHQRALDAALNFLSYRPRSERETRDRLSRGGYSPHIIDLVLERLKELRLVDDESFAQYWIEQRQTHRPRGPRLLRQELNGKGVSREAAAIAVEAADPGADAAYAAAYKKAQQLRSYDAREFQQRLGAFLARRGFDWDVIAPVVKRLWSEVNPTA